MTMTSGELEELEQLFHRTGLTHDALKQAYQKQKQERIAEGEARKPPQFTATSLSHDYCQGVRNIAEMRYHRLSGYEESKPCTYSDAHIIELFATYGGLFDKINYQKEYQKSILEDVLTHLLKLMKAR